jgi:ArsR family transcriptional regulator
LALCAEEELTISELALLLGEGQPQMSRRIAVLRDARLLEARKDGTRVFLRFNLERRNHDVVLSDALAEGKRLCLLSGSLARIPEVVSMREDEGRAHFENAGRPGSNVQLNPAHSLAHLSALALLLPRRELAVDIGVGEGVSLEVLAPLYRRVIAVDRSQAQLARAAERIRQLGLHQISLVMGSFDDSPLIERVDAAGGADLVFAGRALHHSSKPAQALAACARLLRHGGHLVVLDYLRHDSEEMRTLEGDVWLGFATDELQAQIRSARLEFVGESSVSPAFHRTGPDAHLPWHVWVARRPPSEFPAPS